jgi:hypothetical protein
MIALGVCVMCGRVVQCNLETLRLALSCLYQRTGTIAILLLRLENGVVDVVT